MEDNEIGLAFEEPFGRKPALRAQPREGVKNDPTVRKCFECLVNQPFRIVWDLGRSYVRNEASQLRCLVNTGDDLRDR